MVNRARGAIGTVLDKDLLLAAVARQIMNPQDRAWSTLAFDLNVLVETPAGYAVVTSEGVGHSEREGTVGIETLFGTYGVPVQVPVSELLECRTDTTADLADVIRTFGTRLENNFWTWHSQVSNREDRG